MITLKYSQISAEGFLMGMHKLSNAQLNVKAAYNVKKLADAVMAGRKRIMAEFQEMAKAFYTLDADGKPVECPPDAPTATGFVMDETKKAEFEKAYEDFSAHEIKIERPKLLVQEIGNVPISAAELSALDAVIDFGEEAPVVGGNLVAVK